MKVPVAIIIVLVLFPIAICLFAALGKTPLLRLAIWVSAGYLMSQWMQVMIFVLRGRLEGSSVPVELNVFYFIHIKWWWALIFGIVFSSCLAFILIKTTSKVDQINMPLILAALLVALVLSQATGSSIPKLAGEMSYIALFLLGVIAIRFFLTYPPGIDVPAYQRQSDALTSLGLLIGLVSIMGPFIVMLVDLIFKYFADAGVIFQFEITRFGASVAWTLIGVGLIAFECIQALLRAREQII